MKRVRDSWVSLAGTMKVDDGTAHRELSSLVLTSE